MKTELLKMIEEGEPTPYLDAMDFYLHEHGTNIEEMHDDELVKSFYNTAEKEDIIKLECIFTGTMKSPQGYLDMGAEWWK